MHHFELSESDFTMRTLNPRDTPVSASNASIATNLLVDARTIFSDEQLLDPRAFAPVAKVLDAAAHGTVPRSSWVETLRAAVVPALASGYAVSLDGTRARPSAELYGSEVSKLVVKAPATIGELIGKLRSSIAPTAHASRVRGVLRQLGDTGAHRVPLLVQLLRGSVLAKDPRLQQEILAAITAHAIPPLGCIGLVQLPFLDRHGLRMPRRIVGGAVSQAPNCSSVSQAPSCSSDGLLVEKKVSKDAGDKYSPCSIATRTPTTGHSSSSAKAPAAIYPAAGAAPMDLSEGALIFLETAKLARNGTHKATAQCGKHGCIIRLDEGMHSRHSRGFTVRRAENEGLDSMPEDHGGCGEGLCVGLVVGTGWNHPVLDEKGRKRVIHAEAHAVADAILRHGEETAFELFAMATAWIVELEDDAAYGDAPPCRKCHTLLLAVGVTKVMHSTNNGMLAQLTLPPSNPDLLRVDMACKPLRYACDDLGVTCKRLDHALLQGPA